MRTFAQRNRYKVVELVKPKKIRRSLLVLDPVYKDPLISKFINKVMLKGKKATARAIVYQALTELAAERQASEIQLMKEVVEKASPILEVRSRRIGGSTYQVPVEVRPARKVQLVFRWLIGAARKTKGKPMATALKQEMADILNDTGAVVKLREDLHRMAEANRAFAHFARY